MRKKSGSNFQQISFNHGSFLSKVQKSQQIQLLNSFKKTQQRSGGISFYDLVNILNNAGYQMNQQRKKKLRKQIINKEVKIIDIGIVYWAVSLIKKQKEQNHQNHQTQQNQYIDAFVALGGNIDKSGFVSKSTLINTLKNQFQLNFDIELLVQGFDVVNDRLDFGQFCQLFQQDKKTLQKKSSVLSLLSSKSLRNSDSMKSLIVNQKDFQKYLAKMEGHQIYSP